MINTERLIFREWKGSDLELFAEINACKQVCEFLPGPLSRKESDLFAEKIICHFEKNGYGLYALELERAGKFIGFTGLNIPELISNFMPAVEIGWRLAYNYWGKGYATEAAIAVLAYGFDKLALKEIVSFTVPANIRSRRVMERIGLHHNKNDDFNHPNFGDGHRLQKHVLYRLRKQARR